MQKLAILGSGFISEFYASSILGQRSKDEIIIAASRSEESTKKFAEKFNIPEYSTDLNKAINHPDVSIVVIGLPNYLHLETVLACAKAGKGVICTKPLGRNAAEALQMLRAVEKAGIFHGYMEDLVYTPKTLKAIENVKQGSLGRILWAKSRETHPGPHSDWFWDKEKAGGGAILDLACHCIEIGRSFIGKEQKPIEVMCWAATQVKPIDAEDHAIGLVKYANGAIGQFEVSWTFRGGLDIRDEVMGTEGTIWLNHFLRTGFDMFTAPGQSGYVAEKAESDSGWIFPVADENQDLGYNHMFNDMFTAYENKTSPTETFYDGYVVNAIMDAAYLSVKSKKWEAIEIEDWRGEEPDSAASHSLASYNDQYYLLKEEVMPNGGKTLLLKDKKTGEIIRK
ncbi:Gfo/Idh/MocA family protein [Arcticibacterium luteifluviistationis]|uniref:Oxidoreductase n=1 Tax=Arcticibacterium luteifluviistationis TaxID=1784714 RepID=A0A2Z4G6H7_9BACT|nr:Gfo/Idh/MocA family oxidoreductase [Arcticibacterium luteifluviistationis]AWV96710.1 oxidoreductase [Arcticibacterium luteifluviistationis]